jgi:hypothetical protein
MRHYSSQLGCCQATDGKHDGYVVKTRSPDFLLVNHSLRFYPGELLVFLNRVKLRERGTLMAT